MGLASIGSEACHSLSQFVSARKLSHWVLVVWPKSTEAVSMVWNLECGAFRPHSLLFCFVSLHCIIQAREMHKFSCFPSLLAKYGKWHQNARLLRNLLNSVGLKLSKFKNHAFKVSGDRLTGRYDVMLVRRCGARVPCCGTRYGARVRCCGTRYGARVRCCGTRYGARVRCCGTRYGARVRCCGTRYGARVRLCGTRYGARVPWCGTRYGVAKLQEYEDAEGSSGLDSWDASCVMSHEPWVSVWNCTMESTLNEMKLIETWSYQDGRRERGGRANHNFNMCGGTRTRDVKTLKFWN